MYQNTNKEVIRELARENYKKHPARNRLAIFAVMLTTVLIAVIFTVGFSSIQTISSSLGASPGPGADSNGIIGGYEQAVKAAELPQVDWAAYVMECSSGILKNKSFTGTEVYLLAPDQVHYEKNLVKLIKGNYPQNADEILISDTLADKLSLPMEVGIGYDLQVQIKEKGNAVLKTIPMKICGYYKNPLRNVSSIYEEIYTHISFVENKNPELSQDNNMIYLKLNNLNPLLLGKDIPEKLQEVCDAAGGNGTTFKMGDGTYLLIAPIVAIVLIVMLCGYFFIYNIFYISIVNDIHFYGELKTIGATGRQMKRMLYRQMNKVALYGISLGCIAGFAAGTVVSKIFIPQFMDGVSNFYQTSYHGGIFFCSILFAWLTVWISAGKPFRLAAGISPIEAARYREKRKKGIFSIISFSLSGILFLAVFTVTMGFRTENMVERYNMSDVRIFHRMTVWDAREPYDPITSQMIDQLAELPFVRDMMIYYNARSSPDYYGTQSDEVPWYKTSVGEVKNEGEFGQDVKRFTPDDESDRMVLNRWVFSERGNVEAAILGMPAKQLEKESAYIKVLDGQIRYKEFESGEYILYQRPQSADAVEHVGDYPIRAGEKLKLFFYDSALDQYIEREFTVMAVIANHDPYGTSNIVNANFVMADSAFCGIYSDSSDRIGKIVLETDQTDAQAVDDEIRRIIENAGNFQLQMDSRNQTRIEFDMQKNVMAAVGFFLAGLVGLIGISNMANTVSTNILSRKLEFAAMQSIGMTKRQMRWMISAECMRFVYTAVLLAVGAGIPLTIALSNNSYFTGFSLDTFLVATVLLTVISASICLLLTYVLTEVLNKKSVVERLREIV